MPPGNWSNAERREAAIRIFAAVIASPYAWRRIEQDYQKFQHDNPGTTRTLTEHVAIAAWDAQAALQQQEP